ncbi:MAG: 3-phosphoshikimate 1-carboxyvinyltransferase [Polaribacter sp.]|nr:3-phosphoshikimate 1-carboxyvinyltransferase [Polaribacter sp.]MDG1811711.1 3-phosphoshikimate 1-carboxyvinyltransferase [Polaribacter sp.]MDG1994377.1 3-phosphoshikimate 1-carboxyvinyltransferase [Polaribacter sp.]
MNLHLSTKTTKLNAAIAISGSKSESNRLLVLQQLIEGLAIENISDSDDSKYLQKALNSVEQFIDIGHAGTAMRFLTAYFSVKEGRDVLLTGSERMQNRPIEILVKALQDLGANISYVDKVGYPPIRIKGTKLTKNFVQIKGNVSSQYISALMLIASSLPNGLEIELLGEITSVPYINMTLVLLQELGIDTVFLGNKINVKPFERSISKKIIVESDWSSVSYFYSMIALSEIGSKIRLSSYKKESLQGDSCLAEIYTHFGVETVFKETSILIKKTNVISSEVENSHLKLDLKNAPDIAQTIAVTCFGLGASCLLTGLHTLKIKETDRLIALENELTKLGASISVTNDSLILEKSTKINSNIKIETYKDHRMAMAFAPLALKTNISILDANVVTKSYRNFWKDLQQIGFQIDAN